MSIRLLDSLMLLKPTPEGKSYRETHCGYIHADQKPRITQGILIIGVCVIVNIDNSLRRCDRSSWLFQTMLHTYQLNNDSRVLSSFSLIDLSLNDLKILHIKTTHKKILE